MPSAQPQASAVTGGGDGRKLSGSLDDLQCTTAFVQRAGVSIRVADKTKTCSARQPSCRAGVSIRVVDNNKKQNKKIPAVHVNLRAECRSFHTSGRQEEGCDT